MLGRRVMIFRILTSLIMLLQPISNITDFGVSENEISWPQKDCREIGGEAGENPLLDIIFLLE